MNRDRQACPDPDSVAAFIEGALDGPAKSVVFAHVERCDHCLAEIGDAAMFLRGRETAKDPRWSRLAIAASILIAVGLAALLGRNLLSQFAYHVAIRDLVRSAPAKQRVTEAHLSGGFPWASPPEWRRGVAGHGAEAVDGKLAAAAHTVLQRNQGRSSANAYHASGVSELLLGRPDAAIRLLELANQAAPGDPSIDSDLAAAHQQRWRQTLDPHDAARSVAAADRALRIRGDFREALFNRALGLEELQRSGDAAQAWRDYLAADPDSAWAAEAKSHLHRLGSP